MQHLSDQELRCKIDLRGVVLIVGGPLLLAGFVFSSCWMQA